MTIDLTTKKVSTDTDFRYAVEFPVVSDRLVGKDWSVTYAALIEDDKNAESFFNCVGKYNRKNKEMQVRKFGQDNSLSEPILIETKEGDYLITVVYQSDKDKSFVHVLSEKTLEDVCVLELPGVIPPGFHGRWDYDKVA